LVEIDIVQAPALQSAVAVSQAIRQVRIQIVGFLLVLLNKEKDLVKFVAKLRGIPSLLASYMRNIKSHHGMKRLYLKKNKI